MSKLFETHIRELSQYRVLCESLFSILEKNITLKNTTVGDFTLRPTQKTILSEILHLKHDAFPEFRFPLPPETWIEPSVGQIENNGNVWRFVFHGMGVSFNQGNNDDNWRDISIEFSNQGIIAVTKWTTRLFFKTNCKELPEYQELLAQHTELFHQALEAGFITPVEPLLSGDQQTYGFGAKLR